MEIRRVPPGDSAWTSFEPGAAADPVPADAACWVALDGGAPAARVGTMLRPGLQGVEDPPWGVAGHFAAASAAGAVAVLGHATATLQAAGATCVLGPMNGNSWFRYRLVLPPEPGDAVFAPAAFHGEPANPPDYPAWFAAAGFQPADRYESRIYEDLSLRNPRGAETAAAIADRGLTVRPVDFARWEEELGRLHALCHAAFARNRYFEPVNRADFRRLFAGLEAFVPPDLFLLAETREGTAAGVVLAYPDPACGPRPDRIVLKTLACAPETRGLGLAVHLTELVHREAHRRGFRSAIHALMSVDNRSAALSRANFSRVFKRYGLFAWRPAGT